MVIPISKTLETFNKLLFLTILSAIVMMILMVLASSRFIYKQLKPLQFLKAAIETAAKGDLTKKGMIEVESLRHRNEETNEINIRVQNK